MKIRNFRRQRRHSKYLTVSRAAFGAGLFLAGAGGALAQCVTTGPVTTNSGCVTWSAGDFIITSTGVVDGTANPLPYALNASGSVGTLLNQGIIRGGSSEGVGIGAGTLVPAIINEGTIISPTALRNVGTVTSLTNASTGIIIGSDGYGVEADGRFAISGIGTVANNGTITASSSTQAAIAAVATVGTLTGIGTIVNNGSILATSTGGAGIGGAAGSTIGTVINAASGSITGVTAGILNNGTIGTISNHGLIAGTSTAGDAAYGIDANGGSIGLIDNGGTIRGAFAGVVAEAATTIQAIDNTGTIASAVTDLGVSTPSPYTGLLVRTGGSIGSVTNSGTITGLYNAIQIDASSAIGTIANSGLIAGDITSASTQDLMIAGGSGTAIGTLTGLSGGLAETDKGFIKLTGANLVFTSGNLLLNDDIGVNAGYAVINNGATLQINNPITVHGDYTQTGGGLAINAANATTYGYLDVSGNASVSNSAISLSGSSLAAGQTYSVVRAAGSAAYSGNTAFVSVNNGLLAQLSTVGGNLVATLAPDAQHHYWDGANTAADGTIAGGSGTWTATGTNWTSTDGTSNGKLDTADVRPVFGGTAGTVTVDNSLGAIKVSGMQFSTDGYRVTGSPINLTAAASAIEVDDNVNATIDSVLQGNGGLAKTGNGLLILNGANTYSGGTTVDAGTLEIGDADHAGASILGDVAVGSAGTLRGHGTIGGSVTNNGVVRPGGSIGTLTIAGNYTQSPSGTLFVDVSPTAASQLKVGGTATLGGTLNVLYGPGTYSAASYRIIDASSVSGQFSSVTSNAPAELAQSVQRLADGSTLTLSPAGTDNGGTDNGGGTGGGTVVVKPTNATIFGAMGSAAIREGQRVNETLLSRLGQACADAASAADCARPGRQAWAQIVSDTAHVRGNDDAPSYKDSHYGFLTGLDHQVGDWTLGIAGGYSHTDVSEDDASGKIDTVRVAGYGSRRLGPVDVAATVGAAYDFLQSRRSFAGLGSAKGDTDGQEITAGLQASLPLATGRFTITPRVGLRYQYFHADSFGENGSTSQNLHVGSQDINSLQPYAQLAVGLPFTTGAARPALVEARVGYAYETLDASRTVAAAASDGTRFTLPGVAPSRGMLTAGVGLTLPLGKAVDITASYDRLFDTGNVSAQAFQLQGRYTF